MISVQLPRSMRSVTVLLLGAALALASAPAAFAYPTSQDVPLATLQRLDLRELPTTAAPLGTNPYYMSNAADSSTPQPSANRAATATSMPAAAVDDSGIGTGGWIAIAIAALVMLAIVLGAPMFLRSRDRRSQQNRTEAR